MALNITSSGATSVGQARVIFIQCNAALTGTITITVAGSSEYNTGSATIGTISNPTVGSQFRYGGLQQQGAISVNPNTTCDITVTKVNDL